MVYSKISSAQRNNASKITKIEEAQIRVDELYEYESLALMNAMIDFDIIQNKSVEDIVC